MPLPVFDRNQGRIQEAEHRLSKAEQDMRNTEVRITTALNTAYQALDAAREGYRLGKFGFLDVLDAQRTLFGAKNQYLMALANYHKSVADVERLVGSGMNETVADSQPEVSR
jgi:cobalt-zinc-cadmium efflux system outer membrane protein